MRRPKFKRGDVVLWMNGVYKAFFVYEVEPLHCHGACQAYSLSDTLISFRKYNPSALHYHVSEEVLEPITAAWRWKER